VTISRLPHFRQLALLGLIPALAGFKCIKYEAPAEQPDAQVSSAAPDSGVFVAATACEQPGTAQLNIANYSYNIVCGCAESKGLKCTVPAGTTVVWTFADSEQHNITSIANVFGMSPDLLAGQFSYTFSTPGTYGYGCSIHGPDMAGYSIVAE
jgi:plastocyanin